MGLTYPQTHSVLLGILGGHFDHRTSVRLPDGSGEVSVPTSSGVGVVYPAEVIRETLDAPKLADVRSAEASRTPRILEINRVGDESPSRTLTYSAVVAEPHATDTDTLTLTIQVAASAAVSAGFNDDEPPTEWVRYVLANYAAGQLTADESLIAQMKRWEVPVIIDDNS